MKKFEVDGKFYVLKKIKHNKGNDTLKLVPLDKKYVKKVEKIADKIMGTKVINTKTWLKEVLFRLDLDYLNSIEEELKKKTKKKVKAHRGCYELHIGDVPLTLTE